MAAEQKDPGPRANSAADEIMRIVSDNRYPEPLKRWMVAVRVQQEIDRAAEKGPAA